MTNTLIPKSLANSSGFFNQEKSDIIRRDAEGFGQSIKLAISAEYEPQGNLQERNVDLKWVAELSTNMVTPLLARIATLNEEVSEISRNRDSIKIGDIVSPSEHLNERLPEWRVHERYKVVGINLKSGVLDYTLADMDDAMGLTDGFSESDLVVCRKDAFGKVAA